VYRIGGSVAVFARRQRRHHRHAVRPGGAHELPLIGHVQHRQRQPTGTPQHRSLQRRLHRRGVSFDQAACRIDSFQHTLKVGERRQVDGVEARFEQVDVDVDMSAVGRRTVVVLHALAPIRGGSPFAYSQQAGVLDVRNRERIREEAQLDGIRAGLASHRPIVPADNAS
jgi:hypothetical protein